MDSINFTFLGDKSVVKNLGKKGTSTDITIYDRKDSNIIRTWTSPTSFPEKIQTLFQAINMGEQIIFYVTKLDKFTGKQIIALDILGKKQGLLCHSYDVDREKLVSMVKGTAVENYKLVEISDLEKEIESIKPLTNDGAVKITIDHCFDAKGVGTVVLGRVNRGKVTTYDNLKILPKNVDIVIKSIQMQDDTVEEARSPARVGLSIKGVSPDDIQRGDIISEQGSLIVSQEITLNYIQNNYFKETLNEGQSLLINIGLQTRSAKIISINPMKLQIVKPVVFDKDDICVLLKPESQSMRIVGSGKIV